MAPRRTGKWTYFYGKAPYTKHNQAVRRNRRITSDMFPKSIPEPRIYAYKKLKIKDSEELNEYMKMELQDSSVFRVLRTLEARQCDQELDKFLFTLLNRSHGLEELTVENCELLEQVFDLRNLSHDKEGPPLMPKLRRMRLCGLPKLNCICNNDVELGNLHELEIIQCDFLKGPLSTALLAKLHSLKIKSCEMIEQVLEDNGESMFPDMTGLELVSLPKLTKFISNMALSDPSNWRTQSFEKLKHLRVCGCNQLRYILPLNVHNNVQQLENIEISDCEMLERVFADEEETRMRKSYTVKLPRMKNLILKELPKFSGCCQEGSTVEWLLLERVKVVKCPIIQKFSLGVIERTRWRSMEVIECDTWANNEDPKANFEYLFFPDKLSTREKLEIKDSQEMKKYMEIVELWPSSFRKLKILEARRCDQGLSKFLSTLLYRSHGLEELRLVKCEQREEDSYLGDLPPDKPRIFPKLHTMRLCGLPNLNCIWNKNSWGMVELGKLVRLEIIDYGSRKSPLSAVLLEELVLLEALKIESCEMIEQVVEDDTEMQERSFPNLKDLQLVSLPELIKFNSGHSNLRFPHLLSLRIEKCPELKAFTTGFLTNQRLNIEETSNHVSLDENMDACSKLQTLKLVGHKTYEEIWKGGVCNITDYDLKEVEVDSFSKLRYVFPSIMLPILLKKLETLVVKNCSSLSTVFQMIRDNDSIMSFQNLKIVRVKGCASLQRMLLPSSCPSLTELDISDCQSLEDIFIDPEVKADEKCFPNLESIVLENLPMLSSFYLKIFEFPKLRKVRIVYCPAIKTSSKKVSARANNFINTDSAGSPEELHQVLYDIDEDSPFGHGKTTLLPRLAELELSDLPKMQLLKQEPQIPVFENLTSLKIIRCGSIEKLFSISVAQYLYTLKLLTLYKCENMFQVLQGGGGNSVKVFQKLETLVFKHLPRLTSFCEDDVDFGEFPELKMVRVENIPRMETFVKKFLETPKLKEVYVTYVNKCWQRDLNNTITYLHKIHEEKGVWKTDQSDPGNRLKRYGDDTAESS